MNNFIGNIFYFGAPKEGFKVYPNLGDISNIFSGFYTNAEKADWILIAKKTNNITRYTYVKYGLLGSSDARAGSCLGISIEFINYYFSDLEVLRTQIIEKIWDAFLIHKKLIERNESSGKVVFNSVDFFDVGSYLDDMTVKVKESITDHKFSSYVKSSIEIPDSADNLVYSLRQDSSPRAIIEYFKKYGIVKLSPISQLEEKSFAEREEENKKHLQDEVDRLTKQLEQKNNETNELLSQKDNKINQLEQKISRIQQEFTRIVSTEFPVIPVKAESNALTEQPNAVWQKSIKTWAAYPEFQKITDVVNNDDQTAGKWLPSFSRRNIVIGIVGILGFVFLMLYFFSPDNKKADINYNANINQMASPQKSVPEITEPLYIKTDNEKRKGFLKESVFLEKSKGTMISSETDFKEVLTSYLFRNSPEVQEIYKGDKDALWNKLIELNPTSSKKITNYIDEKITFKIENNKEQQNVLKELVIFSRPSQ